MSLMIGTVYLRTGMLQLSHKLFPGVPISAASQLGVMALFAALSIPALLSVKRGEGLAPLGGAGAS